MDPGTVTNTTMNRQEQPDSPPVNDRLEALTADLPPGRTGASGSRLKFHL